MIHEKLRAVTAATSQLLANASTRFIEKASFVSAFILSGIALGSLFGFIIWSFSVRRYLSPAEQLEHVKIVAAGLVAAATFSTVVWRGLVGARQAYEQTRANNAKDEENTARLMFDGAKLIGEANEASIVAGIAGLEVVIKTPNSPFATTAMNVLADFTTKNIVELNKSTPIEQARRAMEQGVERGLFAQRKVRVDQSAKHPESEYRIFNGFAKVEYAGITFSNAFYQRITPTQDTSFDLCTMISIRQMSIDIKFTSCKFSHCSFKNLTMEDQGSHTFSHCDFSSCNVFLTDPIPNDELDEDIKRYINCFYYSDSAPIGEGAEDIKPYLEARDRPAPYHPLSSYRP